MAATFVLVHGAWHGGWCWIKVARLLRDATHTVYTPTLTGLGERAHLLTPDVDLGTHIQDVVAVLESEELRDVVLVGHSYAGMVISGVAARVPNRIGRLVYLDAFVAEPGRALFSYLAPERADGMRAAAASEGEGWRVPPLAPQRFGVTSARDTEWLLRRLTAQPIKTMEQGLPAEPPAKMARAYVYCSAPATGTFDQFAERLRDDRKWRFYELKTGHDAMVTTPGELTKILMAEGER